MFGKQPPEIDSGEKGGIRGFTLIEVLVAMAVFAIGILAVGSMQLSAVSNNGSARSRTEATALAAKWAEDRMSIPFSDLVEGNTVLPTSRPGDPEPAYYASSYRVDQIVDLDNPTDSTATITIRVCWFDNATAPANCNSTAGLKNVSLDFIRADM